MMNFENKGNKINNCFVTPNYYTFVWKSVLIRAGRKFQLF